MELVECDDLGRSTGLSRDIRESTGCPADSARSPSGEPRRVQGFIMFRITFVITAALAGLPFSALAASADASRLAPAESAMASAPSAAASARQAACSPSGCSVVLCPPGYICVYRPKQCFTLPCPQYECVRAGGGYPVGPPYVYPQPYPRPGWPQWHPPVRPPLPRPAPLPYPPSWPATQVRPNAPTVRDLPQPAQQAPGQPTLNSSTPIWTGAH